MYRWVGQNIVEETMIYENTYCVDLKQINDAELYPIQVFRGSK